MQICQGLRYGTEVDWWSVGCVMCDMMVGKQSRLEVTDHPEYPKSLTPDVSSILKGVSINGGTTNTIQSL